MKSGTNDEYLPQLYKFSNPQEKTIYIDGLNEYYALKKKYDEDTYDRKYQVMHSGASINNKKRMYRQLKPKCINCGQVGGTIFNRRLIEQKSVQLTAKCGNQQTPCPLDILINLGIIVVSTSCL